MERTYWRIERIECFGHLRIVNRFPKITICGVEELDDLDLPRFSHVISIWDPLTEGQGTHEDVFRRRFAKSARVQFAYFDDVPSDLSGRKAASLEQIRDILTFSASIPRQVSVLIHCWAGISRSTAVGYAILCQSAGP